MNKLNLKKLLTLLVCLTLIVSVVLLAACNKKTDDNKTPDNTSASPSFTNGNFRSYTTSDKGYPYAPSSFTGSPTSDTEGSTLPKLETVKRGVINLADYQNLGAWCTFSKFDAKRLTGEEDAKNYNKDDNVLMINNTEARYYMYRSSEFSAAANTKYLLQVDVRTANLDGGEKKGATIKIAKSYSSGSSIPATEGYASFDAVTVGEWTTYSFIIDGKYNGSTSLELQLMLGNNNLRDEYKTSGYAFFDNIRLTTVKDDTVLPTENVKTITLSVPNGSFDYKTTSDYPYLYNRVTTTDTNSNYGLVNEVDAKDGKITLVNEYAVDAAAVKGHGSVFAIYNVADARMGFYTTNPLYFKRGGYYKVTVSLNTDYIESGSAYLALGKSKDLSDNTIIPVGKDTENPGWKEHVFYVYANENTADELYFHFGLGKDSGDKAKGYILIDDLKIEETDDTTQTGDYVTDNRFKPADNKLTDAFVNKSGTDINGVPVTITGDGEEFSADDKTPYVSPIFSAKNRKFTSAKATLAKFQTTAKLQKDTYYRFSVWVRTVDVPSTSGVVLTVYDGDKDKNSAVKAIATFAAVTTDKDLADSSSSLNGYRELVCYFHTASTQDEQPVTFEISLGSGGAFTSSTLFSGTAYIANASLVETDYTKYNGASASGTYEKKYDWYETLSSETFTNGQFQKYNYSDTKFFKDGGKDSSNTDAVFQSTAFGVPSGWTLKGEKDKAVAGIVDVNRENLLNNLATKLGVSVDTLKTAPFKCKEEDVAKYGIYAGGDSYLLINSANVEGLAKEYVRVGYVSNSFTLNANSYYKISVMVKVMGDSKASVYLMTDNNISETNVDSKFENIVEASTASQTGGWKRYTFYVKTGFSSISATLGLYLGGQDKDVALTDANMVLADGLNGKYVKKAANEYEVYNKNTHKDATETYNYKDSAKGGTVLFDYVIKEDISESVYNAKTASATASAADEYEETKRVEMNLDSFGLATTPDENKPTSPKGWTKTSLTKDTDTEQLQSGVIYSTDYKAHSGESCLIIPYLNTAGASYYASDAKTLTKDGFYKISVWAKLSEGHTGKAYITLVATNYGENSKYVDYASQTIEVNSTDWKEYVFFIKAPSSDTKIDKYGENAKDLSLKIRLGFGESADNKASGYVLFDDVLIEKLDVKADDFDKHVNDFKAAHADLTVNTVKYSAIDKEEETTPDKEPDKENNKDSGKNFNWVIFTSVAFGAIVVIAVAAFFIKKYLPKHKEGKQQVDKKKTSKKKEDDYKNLND
ncbi:MAG: hypothetical protein KH349_06325 [Clostridium sp.]|nr:hypothetical protein [Clostridium sp.]